MFRPSTIIREPALNLTKVMFMLKHSVELRRYLLCGCVAVCCRSHIYVYFNINFNVFFKLIKVHLLVRKLYTVRAVLHILKFQYDKHQLL